MTRTGHGAVKAVLGPTNTGKTHLAIERLVAHSSGVIGFPLRLLAREVYDRVVAIKGEREVALITGEERIEPANARWLLCTAEAMPRDGGGRAFVAIDEAQLAADPERGHVFTDRVLNARGREETMLLGSSSLAPMVRELVPEAEIVSRPRFSTLRHDVARKLSRIPPRSAIVAFSAEQVYAVAEMLRRFRGGAAVVMGSLSPRTRNAQVAMFQSGEVDYIVATDAIGMGLNLDVSHVAFAGLSKFDGHRQRRLTISEMAQIAGRAGRHQKDGTFGTLSGGRNPPAFTPEEIYAIEEHRFPPLTRLFWREAQPRFDSIDTLLRDLASPPRQAALRPAPVAIDLAVLRLMAERTEIRDRVRTPAQVRRLWEACSLPDFRQQGAEVQSRFVARLWEDLGTGDGFLGADYVTRKIAELDRTDGDIDTLGMRVAAIRSWAYIAQRPDWILQREEMAARARDAETRLSDALHARLTERFVNRRTSVLLRNVGADHGLLPVTVSDDEVVSVDGHAIGTLDGFSFKPDPAARAGDRRLLLAAADRHLTGVMADRANALVSALSEGREDLALGSDGALTWQGKAIAKLVAGRTLATPRVELAPSLAKLDAAAAETVRAAAASYVERRIARLAPCLAPLEEAANALASGAALRAFVGKLLDAGGAMPRAGSGIDTMDLGHRAALKALGVRSGSLDVWHPALLKPDAMTLLALLRRVHRPNKPADAGAGEPVIAAKGSAVPAGYRQLGKEAVRVDLADRLVREAHGARGARRRFVLSPDLARSMGLSTKAYARLLAMAGFRPLMPRPLPDGAFGPPTPLLWHWQPPRRKDEAPIRSAAPPAATGVFAALADLLA